MSLVACPYSSLCHVPPLHAVRTLSPAAKRTVAASHALSVLQSLPLRLDLFLDSSPDSNPFFGLLVTGVKIGSSAEDAGLRAGDVILELKGARTVAVEDVEVALRGCIAGDVVSVVVERSGEERELRVMLEGEGMERQQLQQLYAVLDDEIKAHEATACSSSAVVLSPSSLSLSDLLDVPQFTASLLSFMSAARCRESLDFLLSEQAYQRIPHAETHRLQLSAHRLYHRFIAEEAEETLNIRASTRKAVLDGLNAATTVSPLLFHAVSSEVYHLVEADVLPRYLASPAFQSLCSSPTAYHELDSASIGRGRRRRDSFSCIPAEERRVELEDMRAAFLNDCSAQLSTHRRGMRKHRESFEGGALLRWLLSVGVVQHEAAAVSLAQRMMDALLLWRCDDAGGEEDRRGDFSCDEALYSFLCPEPAAADGDDDGCDSGYVFLKGVLYTRLWLKVHRKRRRLALYRDHHSKQPLLRASLRHASMHINRQDSASPSPSTSASSSPLSVPRSNAFSSSSLSPSVSSSASATSSPAHLAVASVTGPQSRSSSSRGVAPVTPPPSPPDCSGDSPSLPPLFSPSVCYLHLHLKESSSSRRELVFRVDDEEEGRGWQQLLSELGVQHLHDKSNK